MSTNAAMRSPGGVFMRSPGGVRGRVHVHTLPEVIVQVQNVVRKRYYLGDDLVTRPATKIGNYPSVQAKFIWAGAPPGSGHWDGWEYSTLISGGDIDWQTHDGSVSAAFSIIDRPWPSGLPAYFAEATAYTTLNEIEATPAQNLLVAGGVTSILTLPYFITIFPIACYVYDADGDFSYVSHLSSHDIRAYREVTTFEVIADKAGLAKIQMTESENKHASYSVPYITSYALTIGGNKYEYDFDSNQSHIVTVPVNSGTNIAKIEMYPIEEIEPQSVSLRWSNDKGDYNRTYFTLPGNDKILDYTHPPPVPEFIPDYIYWMGPTLDRGVLNIAPFSGARFVNLTMNPD